MKKTILLVTDLAYEAKGRDYFKEDVALGNYLRKYFHVWMAHISDIEPLLDQADVILLRNTGPLNTHEKELEALKRRSDLNLFNDLKGKGDLLGKQHLLDLYRLGFPVIPTFNSINQNEYQEYLLKPLNGADSQGVKILKREEINSSDLQNNVLQPLIEFKYEVSFYFIGGTFHYALYAPDVTKRWELQPYSANETDIAFASQFIAWNTCKRGIQRVDACFLATGERLLMELEDYNPFLSLDCLPKDARETFLESLCHALDIYMI